MVLCGKRFEHTIYRCRAKMLKENVARESQQFKAVREKKRERAAKKKNRLRCQREEHFTKIKLMQRKYSTYYILLLLYSGVMPYFYAFLS